MLKNKGPSFARNIGLKKAKGEYVMFVDIDDTITTNILSILYGVAKKNNSDIIFSDKGWIENSKNQRKNHFIFPKDKKFKKYQLIKIMKKRFNDPVSNIGIFNLTGRLIRRSIIIENHICFEEKLRYLEDETFIWDILPFVKNANYIRKQLYSYHVNPNVNSALSEGLSKVFPISYFKLVKNHVENSLNKTGIQKVEIKNIVDQALIYLIISGLVSLSRSIILRKIDKKKGIIKRKKIIKEVLNDQDVAKSIKNYEISKQESSLIPIAILSRSYDELEFACDKRAMEILNIRRKLNKF